MLQPTARQHLLNSSSFNKHPCPQAHLRGMDLLIVAAAAPWRGCAAGQLAGAASGAKVGCVEGLQEGLEGCRCERVPGPGRCCSHRAPCGSTPLHKRACRYAVVLLVSKKASASEWKRGRSARLRAHKAGTFQPHRRQSEAMQGCTLCWQPTKPPCRRVSATEKARCRTPGAVAGKASACLVVCGGGRRAATASRREPSEAGRAGAALLPTAPDPPAAPGSDPPPQTGCSNPGQPCGPG